MKKFHTKFNKNSDKNLLGISSIFVMLVTLFFLNTSNIYITILNVSLDLSTLAYILSFIIAYAIHEKFGKENSKQAIKSGFITIILLTIGTYLVDLEISTTNIFMTSIYAILTKAVIYLIPHMISIWIYGIIKYKTNYKFLWLRSTLCMSIAISLASLLMFIDNKYINTLNIEVFSEHTIIMYSLILILLPLLYLTVFLLRKRIFSKKPFKHRSSHGKSITNHAKNTITPKKHGENARRPQNNRVYK